MSKKGTRLFKVIHWQRVIRALDGPNITISDITRRTFVTYSHLCAIKAMLQKNGIITCTEDGKKSLINLTEKGKSIKESLNEQLRLWGISDNIHGMAEYEKLHETINITPGDNKC